MINSSRATSFRRLTSFGEMDNVTRKFCLASADGRSLFRFHSLDQFKN